MDSDDYIERKRLLDLVDEANRAKQVWMNEYLRMLDFNAAAKKAFQILENHIVSEFEDPDLLTALKVAKGVMADELKPIPTPSDPKRTFRFLLNEDFDIMAAPNAMGMYSKPEHQRLWEAYQAGAKFGFRDRSKKE